MKFQVRAMIPGSTAQGASTASTSLVTAEFKVILVKQAEVETCDGNFIRWDGLTKNSDSEREPYTYNIPKANEAAVTLPIEALQIITTKSTDDCPVEMVAEYFDGYWSEHDVMWIGQWMEVRTDDF
jgi:hypothetical protein